MKVFLGWLLGAIMLFCFVIDLPADEGNSNMDNNSLFFHNNVVNHEFDFFASTGRSYTGDFSIGRRIGACFLNIFLGLGSYTMGDWLGGTIILLGDIAGVGLLIYGFDVAGTYSTMGKAFGSIILGSGICLYTLGYSFYRPFRYKSRSSKTANLDDLRNWDIGIASNENGRIVGRIAFTAHF